MVYPERIVFINAFADEEAQTIRAPFRAIWSPEVLHTHIFTEQESKTTFSLRVIAIHATGEEHQTFEAGLDSMQQGFGGTFDQLAGFLARG